VEVKMLGLYLHVPFCIKKCNYCDFNSYSINNKDKDKYLENIVKEMNLYKEDFKDKVFTSVFIGGGTPTILKEDELEYLFNNIYSNFNIHSDAEISIEANPGTLTKSKLKTLYNIGVNRLSIGLQAYQQSHLDKLGRIHTFEEFAKNYEDAKNVGFNNINIDLMYALPNQTIDEWEETLQKVVMLNPTHISAYSLIIEEGTKFYELYENKELNPTDEELDIKMYRYTIKYLKEYGYNQYEISNYSKKGYECNHNIIYWKCEEYLGLGPGASGYIDGVRYSNIEDLDDYFKTIDNENKPVRDKNILEVKDKIEEKIFMGLRMNEGIYFNDFAKEFNINFKEKYKDIMEKLRNNNLIDYDDKIMYLTQKGIEVSNSVFIEFLD
jgi:oxygen-independent coproporphyrinogen III oxidase